MNLPSLLSILFLTTPMRLCLADIHISGGAVSTNVGAKLNFTNGRFFDANLTNYSIPQILRTNGLNAGHYRGDNLTFVGLAATVDGGGPIPGHAAVGSRLALQVVSVEGPLGGAFEFWEGDGEFPMNVVTFSVPTGTMNGTNLFVISDNSGQPDGDPYGHIHGRELTTSAVGTYTVGFRLLDLSTNGPGGGPIHAPSDVMPIKFQAGLRAESIQLFTNRASLTFRSPTAISNVLEAASSPDTAAWEQVAGPLRGNNNPQVLSETNAPSANRFYRLRTLNNFP